MSLTLSKLESIIDNTIENESKILIICDREIASIVEEYCDDYDFDMLHNVIDEYIPYEHRNSGYAITINCLDGEYEYYIDFYRNDTKIVGTFDEIHIIGKEFNGFDWHNKKLYVEMGINHGDMIIDEDDLPITQEEHDRWVKAEGGLVDCVECCVECDETNCEFQGNIDDCDCDECVEYKESLEEKERILDELESMDEGQFDDECCEECCECECHNNEITDEDVIIDYTKAILNANGCIDCTLDIVAKLAGFMKSVGYNEHKEEVFEKLFGDE